MKTIKLHTLNLKSERENTIELGSCSTLSSVQGQPSIKIGLNGIIVG